MESGPGMLLSWLLVCIGWASQWCRDIWVSPALGSNFSPTLMLLTPTKPPLFPPIELVRLLFWSVLGSLVGVSRRVSDDFLEVWYSNVSSPCSDTWLQKYHTCTVFQLRAWTCSFLTYGASGPWALILALPLNRIEFFFALPFPCPLSYSSNPRRLSLNTKALIKNSGQYFQPKCLRPLLPCCAIYILLVGRINPGPYIC